MEPTVRALGVRAKGVFVGVRLVLVTGLLVGLPSLAPDVSEHDLGNPHSTFSLSQILKQTPVQANERAPSSGLQDWPDLFGEGQTAAPVSPTGASRKTESALKVPVRPISTAASRGSIAPPRTEDPPFLESIVNKAPLSSERTTAAPSAPKTSQVAVAPEAPSKKSEPASKPTSSRKGFVIKVEGEGKELVVYDAEGKEVLRKSRKKETDGTTISGSGKTMTNRDSSPAAKETREQQPVEVAKPKQEEKAAETPKSRLVFDTVKKGENLSLIASRYEGVSSEDLLRVNQIDNPHTIPAGTRIWIPCDGLDGVCHTAEAGDTLSSLLRRYEIEDMRKVCDLNGLDFYAANRLNPGQMVVLPEAKAKNQPLRTHTARAIRSDLSKLKGNVRWQWPVEEDFKVSSTWGRRVDPFSRKSGQDGAGGPKPRFSMHHGVDLAVPVGTPVYAARDGEVIEVSRSRYGHGNMIKLRHEDGWCTVYSHNSELLKKEGDIVKQGDLIALSGNSGRSTGPHLHFEIRRPNQESVNPNSFLPSL